MKMMIRSLILTCCLGALFQSALAAVEKSSTSTTVTKPTTPKLLSMSNVLQQLQNAGYIVIVAELKKDDGIYKIDAIDKHGEKQSFDVNAAKGLTPEQKAQGTLSMAQAAKKAEKPGLLITSISLDSGIYKVTLLDTKGEESTTNVDLKTGQVTK